MTPSSLMSGYTPEDKNDPSLLPLLDGKVLVVKEFSAILGLGDQVLRKIMGDLRDAYDGSASKASGTAGLRSYRSKFGFLSAVTPKIEDYQEKFQELGERMLSIRLGLGFRTRTQRRARYLHIRKTMANKVQWRKVLSSIVQNNLNLVLSKAPPISQVEIPESEDLIVIDLCDLLARLRTHPHAGQAAPESATRLLQQSIALGSIRAIADGRTKWDATDTAFIRRILHDTLPSYLLQIIKYLFFRKPLSDLAHLANLVHVDAIRLNSYLQQYRKLRLMESERDGFRLTGDTIEQIKESGFLSDYDWKGTEK